MTARPDASRGTVPVVLDTDLGSDVDDLLALILLAGEPRLDLTAVTTVYGDVRLRAQMASRVLRLLGHGDVPVHAGEPTPQSGREVWWAGHEAEGIAELGSESVAPLGGVDALLAAARRHAGDLVIVAIGPLTNLGEAIDRDPDFAAAVRELVVMGGEFAEGRPEHNIRCDVVAAEKVFAAGIPARFVGLDTTTTVWFDEADLERATASGTELATLVDRQVRAWWRFIDQERCNPHDPLAVLAMIEPELFTLANGSWKVVGAGDRLGALEADPDAPVVRHAATVDVDAARSSLVRRLATTIGGEGAP